MCLLCIFTFYMTDMAEAAIPVNFYHGLKKRALLDGSASGHRLLAVG